MRYTYSTKPEGIEYICTAKATDDGAEIVITKKIKASCHTHAAEEFEEYLEDTHEGFTWDISILTNAEIDAIKRGSGFVFCA